jgi:hypothetical protein
VKPTTESIKGAYDLATDLQSKADTARIQLSKSLAFFIASSPNACVRELQNARSHLATLRRTQTAALRHIDDAIRSAKP